MPLAGTPTQDTVVAITLRDDKGVELARTQALYDVVEAVLPDLSLAGFPTTVSPTNIHDYVVTGTLGVTGYTGDVVLTVSDPDGRVRFVDSGVAGCTTQSARSVVCPASVAGLSSCRSTCRTTGPATPSDDLGRPQRRVPGRRPHERLRRRGPRALPPDARRRRGRSVGTRAGQLGEGRGVGRRHHSDPTVPVTLTATYDPLIAPAPAGCTATATGATCSSDGGQELVFTVDVDRIGNQPRAGELLFAVSVPEAYEDTDLVQRHRPGDRGALRGHDLERDQPAQDRRGVGRHRGADEQRRAHDGHAGSPVADGLTDSRQTVNATKDEVRKQTTAHGTTAGRGKGRAGPEQAQAPVVGPVTGDAAASPTPSVPGNGYGIGQGNGNGPGNGVGQGNVKKADPSPIEQVVDTLSSLLP